VNLNRELSAINASWVPVHKLQAHLEKLSKGLDSMTKSVKGTKIGTEVEAFSMQLHETLKKTAAMKDPAEAMKSLKDADAAVHTLTTHLMKRQEQLVSQDDGQRESLLLGVLMGKKGEPMAEQLKVLQSPEFASLRVSKELLAHHDNTPLFKQAALWVDSHAKEVQASDDDGADLVRRMKGMADELQHRVDSLARDVRKGEVRHAKMLKDLETEEKKHKSPQEKHSLELIKKSSDRKYKKWLAMNKKDLDSMRMAVASLRKGDISALKKTEEVISQSLMSMQKQHNGFLVLLQGHHMAVGRDCPYCAAQCVQKCHDDGKSYSTCLVSCADAGK
jgi:hypothetical protein